MKNQKKFLIASDHAGRNVKLQVEKQLADLGIPYEDYSLDNTPADDYPDFAKEISTEILKRKDTFGILVCGTGIGMSIAANRMPGIRAALADGKKDAELARKHNDANILIFKGWKKHTNNELKGIINAFYVSKFEGGRHKRRLEKLEKA